ncbi:ThiF family adenylyltransferase [Danxiaibacter flavus]|uniref:ThiF family adenylyltransferase n=1 Tax=Danxiaibacter flavus TaxID=3049108 RepID=A0ABV3ZBS7_9BACT|nr:ThiF family adenylyltransferase [Chitinophagaceae bacterium DXS]
MQILPVFYRRRKSNEDEQYELLLREKPYIKIFDGIRSQLKEFVKTANPSQKLSPGDIDQLVSNELAGLEEKDYGVWVYYPWSERMVHLLDEQEFSILRTNRNKYKITDEDRENLSGKKIGVVGMSVGQSVALTLAMERSFGELRIADFDTLDLSNLNRIRAGVHNIGELKVNIVAREIAEIDPFLNVTTFEEGLTIDNIEEFFLKNGKLDVIIDECDSLEMKISLRFFARKHGIPVIMDTSDRGMLDIERFDLQPDRALFHGRIPEESLTNLENLQPHERFQLTAAIVGVEQISQGLKKSLGEIGKTISTWPQLASSVLAGGANAAHVCRKISLGEDVPSGRFYIDVDDIVTNKQ